MAKVGKLTKLKSAIKRLNSISKLVAGRTNSSSSTIAAAIDDEDDTGEFNVSSVEGLVPVFVGKSRRRYLINSDIIDHPLFQELIDRSSSSSSSSLRSVEGGVTVACEVVLFEHLIWMLENSNDGEAESSSMGELVEFYSY